MTPASAEYNASKGEPRREANSRPVIAGLGDRGLWSARHRKYLTNFEQSGSLREISWTSEVLTLARIYDSGKATPLASDPIPDLSSTQSTIICQWQVQVDDSAPREIPRLSSPHRNRLMNACHVVSERCQTWCQIVNG